MKNLGWGGARYYRSSLLFFALFLLIPLFGLALLCSRQMAGAFSRVRCLALL